MCYSLWYNASTMLPANGRQHRGCIIPLFRVTNEICTASIKRRRLKVNEFAKPTKPSMMGGVHRFRQRLKVTPQGASLYNRMSEFVTRIKWTAGFFYFKKKNRPSNTSRPPYDDFPRKERLE